MVTMPGATTARQGLEALLATAVRQGASDLHLTVGQPPLLRLGAELVPLGRAPLGSDEMRHWLADVAPRDLDSALAARGAADFALDFTDGIRFRANVFRSRGVLGATLRLLPGRIPTPDELGLPAAVEAFAWLRRGLVLVTGASGEGKSTTLATLLGIVNRERGGHILTIEDPVEFVHTPVRARVTHREVGTDTPCFADALRASLRQNPDLIVVGEMRDAETAQLALSAAETGHLVLSTLHTRAADSAVSRIADLIGGHDRVRVLRQLADTLRGVVAQRLLPRLGGGRTGVYEVLLNTKEVATLIEQDKLPRIREQMRVEGSGMRTLEQALAEAVVRGDIAPETAAEAAPGPELLEQALHNLRPGRSGQPTRPASSWR